MTKGATDYLVKQIREAHPDTPLLYTEQPGEHGFDGNVPYDTPYIQEGIAIRADVLVVKRAHEVFRDLRSVWILPTLRQNLPTTGATHLHV